MRWHLPLRRPDDLTPEEIAEANELHDAAVQLLIDALAGQPLPAEETS